MFPDNKEFQGDRNSTRELQRPERDQKPSYEEPQKVPTFYREVQVNNENLGFQNRQNRPPQTDFDINQPIRIKRPPAKIQQSEQVGNSNNRKRTPQATISRPKIIKTNNFAKKKKAYGAYWTKPINRKITRPIEKREWNSDVDSWRLL